MVYGVNRDEDKGSNGESDGYGHFWKATGHGNQICCRAGVYLMCTSGSKFALETEILISSRGLELQKLGIQLFSSNPTAVLCLTITMHTNPSQCKSISVNCDP